MEIGFLKGSEIKVIGVIFQKNSLINLLCYFGYFSHFEEAHVQRPK